MEIIKTCKKFILTLSILFWHKAVFFYLCQNFDPRQFYRPAAPTPTFYGPRPPTPKLWPTPPMPFFDPSQNFMDPSHPRKNVDPRHPRHFFYPCKNFTDPLHPRHPRQSLTHDTHEPTHRRYPYQPLYLADSFIKTHGDFQICIRFENLFMQIFMQRFS